ncbi:MAG: metallophosphoesterase [Chitinophagales bacterium]|nr:metallophosphoesterase [Bacteroidota bacterium]MBP7398756.1 metallophosphoesterase [Chitinophagales bacterium]MBK8487560.1 metallophosphoesterase [Bacteroidota bacterium]MBP8753753.1 metallophosphoesterase [Chitinophagales bacterium]MBP9189219.1 metallophosphoesterase [Chitinophagales bacterium]
MLKRFAFLLVFILGIDIYAYQAFLSIFGNSILLPISYFGLTGILLLALFIFLNNNLRSRLNIPQQLSASLIFLLLFPKILISIFMLAEDIIRLLKIGINQLMIHVFNNENIYLGIERSAVWSWLAIGFTILLLIAFVYGSVFNVYNYKVRKVSLKMLQLPKAFLGLKVVQISDIHSGSLSDKSAIQKAVNTINALDPDLVLFTGDLVNNIATEALPLVEIFRGIHSKQGVFSVLGNHDYGDYMQWESPEAKVQNLNHLKALHNQMGWRLLLNEHVQIEKDGEKIIVAGVENWSASSRFPKHGKLHQALNGIHETFTVLLLSHDPSHWEAEVLNHPAKIDVMFAGHTHGMQFGIEIFNFKWSPVKYFYKQWAGLYENNGSYLYVNRGFGVIGYPGRVGILPEITLFTLDAKEV